MGALGAFFRGIGGRGFSNLSNDNIRAAEQAQRQAEFNANREDNQRFRTEQADLDRQSRERMLQERLGGALTRGGRRGAGGDGEEPDMVDVATPGMAKLGFSQPATAQAVEALRTGVNTYTKRGPDVTEQYDEGGDVDAAGNPIPRMRNATRQTTEPDVETFTAMMKHLGGILQTDTGGKPNERADARRTQSMVDYGAAAATGNPSQVAAAQTGALTTAGHGLHGDGGGNLATGVPAKGSLNEARRADEQAQAAARAGKIKASEATTIPALEGLRKINDRELFDLQKQETEANKDMSSGSAKVKADLAAKRVRIETERAAITKRWGELAKTGAPAPAGAASSPQAPPASMLKEGVNTKFKNGGGTWTLRDGKPVQVGS